MPVGDDHERTLRVFEIGRSGPGPAAPSLVVDLPVSWARQHERVEVALVNEGIVLGSHVRIVGDDDAVLLNVPWADHADRALHGPTSSDFPMTITGGEWSGLDQGWWASIVQVGELLYLAEADFDALLETHPHLTLEPVEPGLVLVAGVAVSWNSVSKSAYETAWASLTAKLRG